MGKSISRRAFLKSAGALGVLSALSGCARTTVPADSALPQQSVWVTYPAGSGTYNDIAAIANTVTAESGVRVRLMTGDTGIARMGPLISGTAQYSRAGDEYFYAFEGDDEYASQVWGPQPVRQIWAPPGNYGVAVREDSGIDTVEDLKGRRWPRLIASTAMNRKLEAILNFGGLTSADVELVDISYSEQVEAMKTGHIDAFYQNVVGAAVEELDSQYPIKWLNLGGGSPEQYATWERLAPMVIPGEFTHGAGIEPGEVGVNMQYSIPLTTLADRPKDEVKALLGLIKDNYDSYKDATPDAHMFGVDEVLLYPLVVPFHEGAVEFFQEVGRWTPDLQRRNDALLEREKLMTDAWPEFWAKYPNDANPAEEWFEWKRENLPSLPPVNDV